MKLTDADRINEIDKFLNSRKGTDGYVSAQDYQEAAQKWIGLGGNKNEFSWAFPVESWLGSWEWQKLPADWQPKVILTPKVQVFVNRVQAMIKDGTITFDEAVTRYPEITPYLKP